MKQRILFLLSILLLSQVAIGQTVVCKQDFIIREDIVATGQNLSDTACVQITLLADLEIQPQSSYHALIVSDATGRTIGRTANLHPTISPLSPNSAAIERFGSHPVNLSSGLASQPIPLFDIVVGSISLPISINNHHGGQKVGEVASWVGTGMALNAGSPITRQITGRPDEYLYSYLEGSVQSSYSTTDPNVCASNRAELGRIVRNERDSGADIFNFNGGKFIFVPNSSEVLTLPASKNKIEYTRVARTYIENFKVTDEQGIRYTYRNKENANAYSGGITTSANNAWMLNSIEGTSHTERIELSYDSTTIQNNFDYQDVQVLTEEVSNCGIQGILDPINSTAVVSSQKIQQLKEIKFPSGKAVFVKENIPRDDLDNAFALDKIEIYSYDLSSNSYALVRTYDLVYTYYGTFQNANGNQVADGGKRLFLTQVRLLDADGILQGQYELNYNIETPLPKYLSRGRDMWGYYNGQDVNTSLIPQQTIASTLTLSNPNPVTLTVGSANREPNESFMKAMVLTRMKYPTGGYSDFEYEANRYTDPNDNSTKIAGGLRIAKIKTYSSSTASPITKTYQYGSNGNGTLNIRLDKGLLFTDQNFLTDADCIGSVGGDLKYRRRTFGNSYTSALLPFDGSPVFYSNVTEKEHEGSDYIGKNVYTFSYQADQYIYSGNPIGTNKVFVDSYHWKRGLLAQKETYNKNDVLQYRQIITNNELKNEQYSTYPMGILVKNAIEITTQLQGPCGLNPAAEYQKNNYYFRIGLSKPTLTQEYFYHNGNVNEYQYKETATDYSPNHYFPIETRSLSNDNEQFINRMRYAQDLDPNTLNGGGLAEGWRMLVAKNEYKAIESVTLLRKNNPVANSSTTVIDGQLNTFRSQNNEAVADKIYTLAVGDGSLSESGFYFATASGATINYHPSYIEQVNFTGYDAQNNLTDWTSREGVAHHYNWNTLNIGSLKLSLLQSEVNGHGTSLAQTTQYAYQKPLLGLSQITDPSGRNTFFEYERYGRLGIVRDHNGNILKQHQYGYQTGVAGQNKVVSQQPRVAMATITGDYTQVQTQTSFSDDIGRFTHSLIHNGTADASKDLVTTATTYDLYSRVNQSYLPFPSPSVGGVAVTDFQSPAQAFYADNFPYNQTEYEEAPSGRPIKQFGAGQAWRSPSLKATNISYANASNIPRFVATSTGISKSTYPAHDIVATTTTNEQGNQVITYTDLEGRTVLKSVQESAGNYLNTAYCFDDFGRLAYVIPPELYAWFVSNTSLAESANEFNYWAFGYKFDKFNRMINKKVPSAGLEEMVYDNWDRLVMKRSAMQASLGKWTFNKYDALNRMVMSGEKSESNDRLTLQALADGSANRYEDRSSASPVYYTLSNSFPSVSEPDLKSIQYHDNYQNWPSSGMAFDASNAYHSNFGNATGLGTGVKTRNNINNAWLTSVSYFDDKKRVIQSFTTNQYNQVERLETENNFIGQTLKVRAVHKKSDGSTVSELTENEVDHVGRVIKVFSTIGTQNRIQISQNNFDLIGRLAQKKIRPDGNFLAGGTSEYINRPPNPSHNLHDIATKAICLLPGINISAQAGTYLATIDPNASIGTPINGLQTIDYSYHIRGWLKGINLDNAGNPIPKTSDGDLLAYKLDYETAGFYDGNIGKQSWQRSQDNQLRFYTFDYDLASRLKSASYVGASGENYSLPNLSYDKNGNTTNLQRNGKMSTGSFGTIDNLTFVYQGNRLSSVTDAISSNNTIDLVPHGSGAYTFWPDGSLKSDDNKEITLINYDSYSKLPTEIWLTGGRWVKMYHDGVGKLLKREFSTGEVWHYVNGIIYKNDGNGQPQFYQMATPEGRATFQNDNGSTPLWNYEFFITDHLGNNRVSFSANGTNLVTNDITDFDPTGIVLNGIGQGNTIENRFKWQNKESLALFGLDGINDVGARYLDKTINRWWGVDLMSEVVSMFSPYVSVFNNPVSYIDPDGMLGEDPNDPKRQKDGSYLITEVVITAKRQAPAQYLPFIQFPNNDSYTISNNKMKGYSVIRNYNLFDEWATGRGPKNRLFLAEHPMTKDMQKSFGVQNARAYFYKKYMKAWLANGVANSVNKGSMTNFGASFNGMGLLRAGANLTEQFVGNFRVDITTIDGGENLMFKVSDSKSRNSFYYHINEHMGKYTPSFFQDIERISGQTTPEGNTYQIYMWTEKNAYYLDPLPQSNKKK